MGKYSSSARKRVTPKTERPHAVWRGIGCLMMLIIPAISIAAGYETVRYGLDHNWAIPYQLLGYPTMPDIVYKSSGLLLILRPVMNTNHFLAYAAFSLAYMILIGGVISFAYALIYRMVGPSRYGPLDVAAPKVKVKKYKR
ncbi:MAG: hypothetical protein C4557_06105 [Anaerolineaceae bacterium]|jgi:hypothetical protein|nr:MAG: hypothetical protein C4557_06105 [Anaerolineaceae bacterium]